MGVVIA